MNYEKTQKGNPHSLTINQHIFPVKSIERFADHTGMVDVYLKNNNKRIKIRPDDNLFCARRIWDQRAEYGFMKEIEDKFQTLADRIINGETTEIDNADKKIVNDFFGLWNIRAHNKNLPMDNQKIKGVIGLSAHHSIDEQEYLEKHGITAIRPDLTLPGRNLSGLAIQQNLFLVRKQLEDAKWGVLTAREGEFIVPDNFSNARIVPLTPHMCLFSQSENDSIYIDEVRASNRLAVESSKEYYFAKDISKCPL